MSGIQRIANRQSIVNLDAIWLDIRGYLTAAMNSIAWDEPDRPAAQLERAVDIGLRLPRYYSPEQIEAIQSVAPAVTVDDYLAAMLAPDAAAAEFVAWIRETGRTGEYSSEDLRTLYDTHCQELRRIPTAENMLRKHLRGPGILRRKADGKKHGARSRPTVWVIEETVSSFKRAA